MSDGQDGCGKTTTLSHILHYCYLKQWLMLFLPSGKSWRNNLCKLATIFDNYFTNMTKISVSQKNVQSSSFRFTRIFSPIFFTLARQILRMNWRCPTLNDILSHILVQKPQSQFDICSRRRPYNSNHLLLSVFKIVHSKQNIVPSPHRPEWFDQPDEALTWLKSFQILNDKHMPQVMTENRWKKWDQKRLLVSDRAYRASD